MGKITAEGSDGIRWSRDFTDGRKLSSTNRREAIEFANKQATPSAAHVWAVVYEQIRPGFTKYDPKAYRVIYRNPETAKAWFEYIG